MVATKKASRGTQGDRDNNSAVLEHAYIHLTSARHTTKTLARALGVSPATAFRIINEIRERGTTVDSVKRGREWYFEVVDAKSIEAAWKSDPLVKNIGSIARSRRKPGQSEDDVVYDRN